MHMNSFLPEQPLDMGKFDVNNAVNVARGVLQTIEQPRRRQILENFIEHAAAEANGNYDALMASCSQKSQSYAIYGSGNASFTDMLPQSYQELLAHYRMLIELNMYVIHFDIEKLLVGDDEIAIEGVVHQLYQGDKLALLGIEVDDQKAVYQLFKKIMLVFIFDEEGKGCGEHSYTHGPSTIENVIKLADAEVPELFWNNPMTGKVERG